MPLTLKLFLIIAVLIVVGAITFALGERSARNSAEIAMMRAEQQKQAAEEAAQAAEEAARAAEEAAQEAEAEETQALLAAEQVPEREATEEERAMVLELARTQLLLKAIVTGELKFYIERPPSYAGEGVWSAVNEVAESFSKWNRYDAKVSRVHDAIDADLIVEWVRDYGSHVLGQAIFSSHIKVGLGTRNCIGEWMAFDANTITKILWHELGHSMGYGHSTNPHNVMYEHTETRFEVDQKVSEMLGGGWYYHFPLCGSGEFSYTFETEDTTQGFNLYVLPPETDPKSFAESGGSVYADCGAEGMHRFSGSCKVSEGATVFLSNTSYWNVIRIKGTVIDSNHDAWPDMNWDESAFRYDDSQLQEFHELFN